VTTYSEQAQRMLEQHNPRRLREMRAAGSLATFLQDLSEQAEDLYSETFQAMEKQHPPTEPTYEAQVRSKGQAISAADQMVFETLIAPLGIPTAT